MVITRGKTGKNWQETVIGVYDVKLPESKLICGEKNNKINKHFFPKFLLVMACHQCNRPPNLNNCHFTKYGEEQGPCEGWRQRVIISAPSADIPIYVMDVKHKTHTRLSAMFHVPATAYPPEPRSSMTISVLLKDPWQQSMPSLPPRRWWKALEGNCKNVRGKEWPLAAGESLPQLRPQHTEHLPSVSIPEL